MVDTVTDGEECLKTLENKSYSILLLNENLTGKDDDMIVLRIRQNDLPSNRQVKMRILVVVRNILSINYHAYEEILVDGFLPMPLEGTKLISSIRKAVSSYSESVLRAERKQIVDAKYLATNVISESATNEDQKERKSYDHEETTKSYGDAKNVKSIAGSAIKRQSSKHMKKAPVAYESRFQYDEKTSYPYTIIENCSNEITNPSSEERRPLWCNLLVCHDVFDTYERFKIFFLPMVARYPGMKILLWNYPGQAFTSFKDDTNLNNKYHADCLSKLLFHLKDTENGSFTMDEQFFILAHGSGAAIATYFAATQRLTNLKGIILVNGLSHVDSHFASVFHDCRNVFSCSPENRPDLPVYFYARFLFSSNYLSKTTSSLALNVYTAVHSPITLNGRKRLCQGVLNHVDTRQMLKDIGCPIVSIHGENATLVRAIHSAEFLTGRRSCSTIPEALKGGNSTVIVLMKGGHELFQEKKYHISLLVEQILTGFHEKLRVQQHPILASILNPLQEESICPNIVLQSPTKIEDVYIDKMVQEGREDQTPWGKYKKEILADQESKLQNKPPSQKAISDKGKKMKALDEKDDVGTYENPEVKEVKEYMEWRVKRQKKRFAKLEHSAVIIQCALRCFMAKTLKDRLRKQIAATMIQCYVRGIFGRAIYQGRRKELWAALFIQRVTRGHVGRRTTSKKRIEIRAQTNLARMMRGISTRRRFHAIVNRRDYSASRIQCIWRMHVSIILKKFHRARSDASITIQRCYRGRLGRRKAAAERERFVFSRNQLSGIESGRQVLAELKLHALNLQSAIFLFNQEKGKLEKKIEFHLTEISNFERTVSELNTKMHQIFNGDLVCKNESVVREEKRRINDEITDATAKITDRKEKLGEIRQALEELLKERQEKLEESKKLEAKLSILLDAQVTALEGVLQKQDQRVERVMLANTIPFEHSPLPPRSNQQPAQIIDAPLTSGKDKLQVSHSFLLGTQDSDTGDICRNNDQVFDHQLSSKVPPSKNEQTLQSPKKGKEEPTLPIMDARGIDIGGVHKKQGQRIVPNRPLSDHGNAYRHPPAPTNSNTQSNRINDSSNHCYSGPSENDRMQAAQLIDSTETMLKFGFMSMSLTYFSTLNMMRAMQKVAMSDTLSAAATDSEEASNAAVNPMLLARKFDKSATVRVESWSINDVSKWLTSISLSQYQSAFKEGAVDGMFLCELTDEDLRNTLGVEHRLHRKKILFSIRCLKNYSECSVKQSPAKVRTIPTHHFAANDSRNTAMSPNSNRCDDSSRVDAVNVVQNSNEDISPETSMKSPAKTNSVRDMMTPKIPDIVRYLNQDDVKTNSVRDMTKVRHPCATSRIECPFISLYPPVCHII